MTKTRQAAVNAVSGEYRQAQYPGEPNMDLLKRYYREADRLVIFTGGNGPTFYGRKGEPVKRRPAFRVKAESTLRGTFKAGCVYALLNGRNDDETVSFASACAAAAVMKVPIPPYPPTLERVAAVRAMESNPDQSALKAE